MIMLVYCATSSNILLEVLVSFKRFLAILFITLLFSACSTTVSNITKTNLKKEGVILVLPFENLSQTPYAGYKAASITEGILRSLGYSTIKGYIKKADDFVSISVSEDKYDYVLTGRVIEWRYKTGIDGEPAVSVLITIKDKNNNILWSAVGSKSQWGHRSIAITAQQLINEMFDKIK